MFQPQSAPYGRANPSTCARVPQGLQVRHSRPPSACIGLGKPGLRGECRRFREHLRSTGSSSAAASSVGGTTRQGLLARRDTANKACRSLADGTVCDARNGHPISIPPGCPHWPLRLPASRYVGGSRLHGYGRRRWHAQYRRLDSVEQLRPWVWPAGERAPPGSGRGVGGIAALPHCLLARQPRPGSGIGVGAQTLELATRSPGASFVSVDISLTSLAETRRVIDTADLTNVELRQADILDLPFAPESFDHVFVCFVLEHLADPVRALVSLRRLPPSRNDHRHRGRSRIGLLSPRQLVGTSGHPLSGRAPAPGGWECVDRPPALPLLAETGFEGIAVSPRLVYVDSSRPLLVDAFTRKTFTAMIEAVRDDAIAAGLMDAASFDAGIQALHRTTRPDGVSHIRSSSPLRERRSNPAATPFPDGQLAPQYGTSPRRHEERPQRRSCRSGGGGSAKPRQPGAALSSQDQHES